MGRTGAQMTGIRKAPWMASLLAGAMLLSACEDDRLVLPGQREGLREVLADPEFDAPVANESRPIALGAVQSNTDWAQFWGTEAFRTNHPALSATPQLVWSANIGQGNSRKQRINADPVVGGGRIYTLDSGTTVTATSTSGETVWSVDLQPPNDSNDDATGGGLAFADGRVYVTSGFGFLTVLDAADGSRLWGQDLEATGSGAPTVSGELVYLTAGDNSGWALEKDTGRLRWRIGAIENVSNILGAPAPVVTSDLAIFAFGSGDVQAVFRRGGLRRWDTAVVGQRLGYAGATIGDITGAPVVDGDQAYVGNQSGRIVSISLGNGSRNWTAQEGATGPIWPAGDSVFAVTDRNELVRLSKSDGTRVWGAKLPNFIKERPRRRAAVYAHFGPVLAGGQVILTSSDGQLRAYDPTDGNQVYATEIPSGAATGPAIAGGTLYVVNAKGQLLAYR